MDYVDKEIHIHKKGRKEIEDKNSPGYNQWWGGQQALEDLKDFIEDNF